LTIGEMSKKKNRIDVEEEEEKRNDDENEKTCPNIIQHMYGEGGH